MTREEFEELVRLGFEAPGLEFKPPARRDDARVAAEVVKAAIAISNRRGGGRIVIGVAEDQAKRLLVPVGMTPEDCASWNRDDFSSLLARYASPMVEFEQTVLDLSGKLYLLVTVEEFRHSPIVCTRTAQVSGATVLKSGALYVRGRRKPESVEVSSYEEMRELIDLAVEKGVIRYAALSRQAGLASAPPLPATRDQAYDEELRRFI